MPILKSFELPESPEALSFDSPKPVFLLFIASKDPATGESWCPDVRASLPHIEAAFSADDAPTVGFVEVGQKPEWRERTNVFRTKWNVNNVPTLARFEQVNGKVVEKGRMTEDGIMDPATLKAFMA
ncbi:hypothetical protein PG993_011451 [Apiospora rasikravindrae]|uniref:Thioredoxin domain-containing protein n=1 Tax=Apiospora rasikravindrae TaxID=990691 RepID=A0ABR1SEB2_9PEZI